MAVIASPAAEQRQAGGAPAEAPEPAREQAPASPATEQREAACGSLSPPERAMASGAASKRGASQPVTDAEDETGPPRLARLVPGH